MRDDELKRHLERTLAAATAQRDQMLSMLRDGRMRPYVEHLAESGLDDFIERFGHERTATLTKFLAVVCLHMVHRSEAELFRDAAAEVEEEDL